MSRFYHAICCFEILRIHFSPSHKMLYQWLLLMGHAVRRDGLTLLPPNMREHIADWALEELDFDIILHVLAGDAYFEQNKTDVQKLEQEVGAKVHDLFNTHPIFAKYPRLRTLARDAVFEAWWAMEKQRKK